MSRIGSCDCCDRQNVPISHFDACAAHPEAWACYICQGENDVDPYGEIEGSPAWNEANGQFGVGA